VDLRTSPVRIGTVPIYQALEKVAESRELPGRLSRHADRTAEQRVDYLRSTRGCSCATSAPRQAVTASSRAAARFMAKWSSPTSGELLYTHFREICEIMAATTSLSLAMSFVPVRRPTRHDEAQFAELETLRKLRRSPWTMTRSHDRGPRPQSDAPHQGEHGPRSSRLPRGPFYTLGPLTTDRRAGLRPHHLAIGAAMIGCSAPHALLLTPRSTRLPNKKDVKDGVIAYRSPPRRRLARATPARRIGTTRSRSAFDFRWRTSSLRARARDGARVPTTDPARRGGEARPLLLMCGPDFRSMRSRRTCATTRHERHREETAAARAGAQRRRRVQEERREIYRPRSGARYSIVSARPIRPVS